MKGQWHVCLCAHEHTHVLTVACMGNMAHMGARCWHRDGFPLFLLYFVSLIYVSFSAGSLLLQLRWLVHEPWNLLVWPPTSTPALVLGLLIPPHPAFMCALRIHTQFLMLCSKPLPHWVSPRSHSIVFLIPILIFLCPISCFHISIQLIFKWTAQQLILRDWKTLRNQRKTRSILF